MKRKANLTSEEYFKNKKKIKMSLDRYEDRSQTVHLKFERARPRLKANSILRGYFERQKRV